MVVNGPLSENELRLFGCQETMERFIMRLVHDGAAIMLPGKSGPGFENRAGFGGFGRANGTGVVARPAGPIAAVQIKQDDLVAQIGVTRDSPAAAVFRIARVPTGDDDLKLGIGV